MAEINLEKLENEISRFQQKHPIYYKTLFLVLGGFLAILFMGSAFLGVKIITGMEENKKQLEETNKLADLCREETEKLVDVCHEKAAKLAWKSVEYKDVCIDKIFELQEAIHKKNIEIIELKKQRGNAKAN